MPRQMTRTVLHAEHSSLRKALSLRFSRLLRMLHRRVEPGRCQASILEGIEAGLTPGQGKWTVPRCPLTSLDQLYVQAACIEPIFIHKVKDWALASGGSFPCRMATGAVDYVRWEGVDESPWQFKWCRLKSTQRAIEKVIRSYGEDASRLVDVCRQSIVFDDLQGVSACLSKIAADTDVELLRVKNRLDLDYNATLSGGYRDVNINLRFTTTAAALLGVETHVCELQLILRHIAELKKEEGHDRYVTGRNLRAE